jgi:hypothetical protein
MIKIHLSRIMGEKRINIADLSRLSGLHRNGIAKDRYLIQGTVFFCAVNHLPMSIHSHESEFSLFSGRGIILFPNPVLEKEFWHV